MCHPARRSAFPATSPVSRFVRTIQPAFMPDDSQPSPFGKQCCQALPMSRSIRHILLLRELLLRCSWRSGCPSDFPEDCSSNLLQWTEHSPQYVGQSRQTVFPQTVFDPLHSAREKGSEAATLSALDHPQPVIVTTGNMEFTLVQMCLSSVHRRLHTFFRVSTADKPFLAASARGLHSLNDAI